MARPVVYLLVSAVLLAGCFRAAAADAGRNDWDVIHGLRLAAKAVTDQADSMCAQMPWPACALPPPADAQFRAKLAHDHALYCFGDSGGAIEERIVEELPELEASLRQHEWTWHRLAGQPLTAMEVLVEVIAFEHSVEKERARHMRESGDCPPPCGFTYFEHEVDEITRTLLSECAERLV